MERKMTLDVTRRFAAFSAGLKFEDLPLEVVSRLKLCILDTIGCALYGTGLPWGKIIIDFYQHLGEREEAVLWGTQVKVSMLSAALVNGTLVHSFEIDDLHKDSIVHPGAVTLPPIFALAEKEPALDGKVFLTSMAAGYEVGARVGVGMALNHFKRGFHPTGTIGVFCAGVAAGKVLGLTEGQMIHAIGIAGSQGAGLMAAQFSSMVKRLHAGRAAQSGLLAALLAKRGFTGIEDIVEAEYGGFASSMSDQYDLGKMVLNLGEKFEVINVGFKPYASVGVSHTPIDAIKSILRQTGLHTEDIKKVKITANKATILHAGWQYKPNTITTAQMNLYYCIAALLEEGDVFVDQFTEEKIRDPRILRHISKIEIVHKEELDKMSPELRHYVEVEITDVRGHRYEASVAHAKGSYQNPMTESEVIEKFRKLASKRIDNGKVARIEEMVRDLENQKTVKTLADLLRMDNIF